MAVRPKGPADRTANMSPAQLEICKSVIDATAVITSSMVQVSNEKNPAKISEAYKVIFKSIMETVRSAG